MENVVEKAQHRNTHTHTYMDSIELHNIDQIKFQFIKLELTFLHFKSREKYLSGSICAFGNTESIKICNYRFKSASAV